MTGDATGVADRDDHLYRGIEQARRVIGRAERELDAALLALLALDRAAAVERLAAAGLLLRSGADTIAMVAPLTPPREERKR